MQYEHALALKESGKAGEALKLFDAIVKDFPKSPEAVNSQWRAGQCRREDLAAAIANARSAAGRGGKPEDITAAQKAADDGCQAVRNAAGAFAAQADEIGKKAKGSEAQLRLLYEAAWCYRVLMDAEIEDARAKARKDMLDKVAARMAKELPAGAALPYLANQRMPAAPVAQLPEGPSEKAATQQYAKLIAIAPDAPLVNQARFELAELCAQRAKYDAAVDLLSDCLEHNPAPELAEQIRLRLAACLLGKGDGKSALAQSRAVTKNPGSPSAAEARYLSGEAYLLLKDWPKAIEQLTVFRDQPQFGNYAGVGDHALLRLGQAFGEAGQWDQAKTTFEALAQRFPNGQWVEEAYYNLGWAWQNLKQFDNAVGAYLEVTKRTSAEVAARAQFQIGLCRMEQKNFAEAVKALMTVPYTYNHPALSAPALCQAGKANAELSQPAEAARCWQRVLKDFPGTPWAKVAQDALAGQK
jgi:TolA-binding protein